MELWQLGDVAGDPPRFVHGQHLGYIGIGFCLAPINVSEGLAGGILHLIAAWNLLARPWPRKATYMILVCAPADEIADDKTDPERKHQRSCEIVFHEFFG